MEMQSTTRRMESLRLSMALQKLDVVVISHPKHIFYFTGIYPGPSPHLLLINKKDIVCIAPGQLVIGRRTTALARRKM